MIGLGFLLMPSVLDKVQNFFDQTFVVIKIGHGIIKSMCELSSHRCSIINSHVFNTKLKKKYGGH